MLAELVDHVVGVDPDRDWITLAVLDARSAGVVAEGRFPATRDGYDEAIAFVDGHSVDSERAWVIEGSAGYGRGLAVALERHGEWVIEFDRPTRKTKDGAKSDALDAVRAAREMLGRKRLSVPRAHDGVREAIRVHAVTRAAAVRARTGAINELKAMIVTADESLRAQLRGLRTAGQVAACAKFRDRPCGAGPRARHPQRDAIARSTDPAPRHRGRRARPSAQAAARPGGAAARSPSAASATSPPPSSTSPGHTPAAATAKPPSPASAAPHPCRPPPARTRPATASTEAATANSTGRSTSSPSPSSDATRPPRPTSPAASPKARPNAKPSAASSASSPAASGDSSNTRRSAT